MNILKALALHSADIDTIADAVKDKIGLITTVYEKLRDFKTSNN